MFSFKNSRRRFSLIELLAVILVIIILVSLLFPSYAKSKQRATLLHCMNNEHQFGLSAALWAGNNRGKFPDAQPCSGTRTWQDGYEAIHSSGRYYGHGYFWQTKFVTDPKQYYCPGNKNTTAANTWTAFGSIGGTGYVLSTYVWNGGVGYDPGLSWGRAATVNDPARTPLMSDTFSSYFTINHRDGYAVLRLDNSVNFVKLNPASYRAGGVNWNGIYAIWGGVLQ